MSPERRRSPRRSSEFVSLLKAAQLGSEDAFARLIGASREYLLRIAENELPSLVRPKVAPSDLVQETFLDALRDLSGFEGSHPDDLRAWLRQILLRNLSNAIRKYKRTAKRQVTREVSLPESLGHLHHSGNQVPSPGSDLAAHEADHALRKALSDLPEDYQQVLALRHQEHLSFAEIGRQMGRTAEAARKLWARAVLRLQRRTKMD